MKAALALIFFACVAGSMAADARGELINQLVQTGSAAVQGALSILQQQLLNIAQQALGQVSSLIGTFGSRFDFNISAIIDQFKPLLASSVNQVLVHIVGSLGGLIGGRASINLGEIFNGFIQEISKPLLGVGQALLNQGLSAVLGGLAGSRGFADIFSALQQQIAAAAGAAQTVVSGIVGNLQTIGSNILDASKPHFEQLQEQLVGHGLNVLGSLSETINNVHGSIVGGR